MRSDTDIPTPDSDEFEQFLPTDLAPLAGYDLKELTEEGYLLSFMWARYGAAINCTVDDSWVSMFEDVINICAFLFPPSPINLFYALPRLLTYFSTPKAKSTPTASVASEKSSQTAASLNTVFRTASGAA